MAVPATGRRTPGADRPESQNRNSSHSWTRCDVVLGDNKDTRRDRALNAARFDGLARDGTIGREVSLGSPWRQPETPARTARVEAC